MIPEETPELPFSIGPGAPLLPYVEYPYAEDIKVATELTERLYITTDAYKQLIRKWLDRFGVKP